ncbi:MAG: cytochrome c [Bradyrhizobiaceae bacterium]|nr:cytochrome c [Bradyrhizobiaceae bacterium]
MLTAIVVSAVSTLTNNGKRLALQWCASCHLVARDQTGPTSEAPPFPTLAARTDFDATKIAQFLMDPHPKMPNMELTGTKRAYIKRLK